MKPLAALLMIWPGLGWAVTLDFPAEAVQSLETRDAFSSYQVPIGPFAEGRIKSLPAEGEVVKQAWRIKSLGGKTLEHLAPLRDQLTEAGFDILYECAARDCGGFDFRFAADVLPAPEMYVDLDNFRFLSARRGAGGAEGSAEASAPEFVTLLVSASQSDAFIQVVAVGQKDLNRQEVSTSSKATEIDQSKLGAALLGKGHYVLADLTFATGSSRLEDRKFPSLAALADFLKDDPKRHVVLVGHTDAVGSLEANIDLSRKRAASVAERLVSEYSVAKDQVEADGVGFLSPIASNLEAEGRKKNRRVEVVLTTTH